MPGNPTGRTVSGANGTMWRGLIVEIKIYNRMLTLAEIQTAQVSPAMPPYLLQQVVTNSTVLSGDGVWQLQSRTNLSSGNWINVNTPQMFPGRFADWQFHLAPRPSTSVCAGNDWNGEWV